MDREAGKLYDVAWVAQCANRLRTQWPRADPTSLEETAVELWDDAQTDARWKRVYPIGNFCPMYIDA